MPEDVVVLSIPATRGSGRRKVFGKVCGRLPEMMELLDTGGKVLQ
jgi:hypothetical protein